MNAVNTSKKKLNKFLLSIILEVLLLISLNIGFYFYESLQAKPKEKIYLSGDLRLEVLSYTKELVPGHHAQMKIQGRPNHNYKLSIIYYSGPSEASGLGWKKSDDKGIAEWNWKVGTRTYAGQIQAIVSDANLSGSMNLTVVNAESSTSAEGNFLEFIKFLLNMVIVALIAITCCFYKEELTEENSRISPLFTVILFVSCTILAGAVIIFLAILAFFAILGILTVLPNPIKNICWIAIKVIVAVITYSPLILMVIIIVANISAKRKKKK